MIEKKCPVCKRWVDLSRPHVIVNGKICHPDCGIEYVKATSQGGR